MLDYRANVKVKTFIIILNIIYIIFEIIIYIYFILVLNQVIYYTRIICMKYRN